MRISKEKAAENRAALIRAASKLFRERGIDGVGVAEISKEAGLTHGALYAHFKSKDDLALAALAYGFEQSRARMAEYGASGAGGMPDLAGYLDACLSPAGRDDLAGGCPMPASASEAGRHGTPLSACFAEGYLGVVDVFERHIAQQAPAGDARARALVAVAAMTGALAVARATARGDPALSAQVLEATRKVLDELMLGRVG